MTISLWTFENIQSPNSQTFSGGWKVDFSRRAVFSKVMVDSCDHSGYNFCVNYKKHLVYILEKNINNIKWLYICILYRKYLRTYLEALHSHFQTNHHFKMFKNSGSELEFLNIFKCNSAESARTGIQFNYNDIFNYKTLNYWHLDHFSSLLKFTVKNLFYH